MWGTAGGKRLLTQKLVNRWMTGDPRSEELGTVGSEVLSLFCNDGYIFCGHENGIVNVFSIVSGDFVRQLFPDENVSGEIEDRSSGEVAGKEGLVASSLILGNATGVGYMCVGSIWSSSGQMELLDNFSFHLLEVEGDGEDGRNERVLSFHLCSLTRVVALMECAEIDHHQASLLIAKKQGMDGNATLYTPWRSLRLVIPRFALLSKMKVWSS